MQLNIKNLNKSYLQNSGDTITIFNNLNFETHKKENIILILGPSGIGKSTFLNLVGTIDEPDSGQISLDNIVFEPKKFSMIRKKYISYMFQFHYLLPEFTVFENLEIAIKIRNVNVSSKELKTLIDNKLKKFNIYDKINHYPYQLSGGEKQRVSLVRSVITKPLIVLADEPTGNLDFENSLKIISEIKSLSVEDNIKFIIASHDKNFESIADTIYEVKHHQLKKNI